MDEYCAFLSHQLLFAPSKGKQFSVISKHSVDCQCYINYVIISVPSKVQKLRNLRNIWANSAYSDCRNNECDATWDKYLFIAVVLIGSKADLFS